MGLFAMEARTLTDFEMLEKVFIPSNQASRVRLLFYLHVRAARHSLGITKTRLVFQNFDSSESVNKNIFKLPYVLTEREREGDVFNLMKSPIRFTTYQNNGV